MSHKNCTCEKCKPIEKLIPNAKGLNITTVKGEKLQPRGEVTYKNFPKEGIVYYCAGESWSCEIVDEIVYFGELTNE